MILPMSTFALAIGKWKTEILVRENQCVKNFKPVDGQFQCGHDPYPCHVKRGDSGEIGKYMLQIGK